MLYFKYLKKRFIPIKMANCIIVGANKQMSGNLSIINHDN